MYIETVNCLYLHLHYYKKTDKRVFYKVKHHLRFCLIWGVLCRRWSRILCGLPCSKNRKNSISVFFSKRTWSTKVKKILYHMNRRPQFKFKSLTPRVIKSWDLGLVHFLVYFLFFRFAAFQFISFFQHLHLIT